MGSKQAVETKFESVSKFHDYEERDTEVALICPEGPKRKRRKPREPKGEPEEDDPGGEPEGGGRATRGGDLRGET